MRSQRPAQQGLLCKLFETERSNERGRAGLGSEERQAGERKARLQGPEAGARVAARIFGEPKFGSLARKIRDFRSTKGLAMVQIRCLAKACCKTQGSTP